MSNGIFIILPASVLLLSHCKCSSNSDGASDGAESELSEDREMAGDEGWAEDMAPGDEAGMDSPDHDLDGSEDYYSDLPEDLEMPEGCRVPIMDCGPGCRQLTCAESVWEWDVWGDKLVYATTVPGNNPSYFYLVDIPDGAETRILDIPLLNDDRPHAKSISLFEDSLACYVWYSHQPEEEPAKYVKLIDISLGTSRDLLSLNKTAVFWSVSMFGENIVWSGHNEAESAMSSNVFLFDLGAMEMRYLTNEPCCNYEARIYENNVVYHDGWTMTGSHDCKLIDLWTEEDVNITNHPRDQWDCRIWGGRIAWTDHRNAPGGYAGTNNADIYWCDLPDCATHHAATTNWAGQVEPEIWEDIIVWLDFRNDHNPLDLESPDHSNLEIWGINVNSGEEVQLASHDQILSEFRVHDDKLFFRMAIDPDRIYSTSAVFMKDLPF